LASLGAVLLAVCILGVGFGWARGVQERLLHSVAPEFCDAKLHGVALIREALSRPDTLLLFGSSELIPDVPMKGVDFFANSPTGFSVFPVGKAGTTALSVLQKLGGAGEALSGKKVVLSLSPSFFQSESVDPKYFEGNSSKLQTKEMLWSSVFSDSLKQAAALQILKYPKAYEGDWMLEFTLQRVARGGWMDRIALALMEPYAVVDRAVNRFQDHAEATAVLLESPEAVAAKEARSTGMRKLPNWDELFALAEQSSKKFAARAKRKALKATRRLGEGDLQFVNRVQNAQEWHDFELVLRLLREAGAQPLVISMPVHADILEAQGISKRGWMEYGRRLKAFTARYGTPLVYLEEHERDPVFFVDQADHIGSKGWWFYNKAMDDFFHGRVTSQPMASQTILRK
jgi:D-alanine transfer protein